MFCKKLICAECVPTLAITVHGIASVSINILLSVINKMMEKKSRKWQSSSQNTVQGLS